MKKVIFTIIVLLVLLPLGCKEEIKEPVKKTLVSDKEYIYIRTYLIAYIMIKTVSILLYRLSKQKVGIYSSMILLV